MLSRITSRASLAFIAIMLLVVISVFLLLIYLRLAAIEQTLSGLDVIRKLWSCLYRKPHSVEERANRGRGDSSVAGAFKHLASETLEKPTGLQRPFRHGVRGAVGLSRMPIARIRRLNASP